MQNYNECLHCPVIHPMLNQMHHRSQGETQPVSEWHFHPDEIVRPGFVADDAIDFWDRTNREDWAISERSYQGISSRGYVPGPYSTRELQLWEFDQFVARRVNGPS